MVLHPDFETAMLRPPGDRNDGELLRAAHSPVYACLNFGPPEHPRFEA
jgi:hypothetical protein